MNPTVCKYQNMKKASYSVDEFIHKWIICLCLTFRFFLILNHLQSNVNRWCCIFWIIFNSKNETWINVKIFYILLPYFTFYYHTERSISELNDINSWKFILFLLANTLRSKGKFSTLTKGYWMRNNQMLEMKYEIFITLTKYNTCQRREEGNHC